jgi:Na+-transporting methylmalonyl-CoA/oxaloacetate decarboxylase gamma subunit
MDLGYDVIVTITGIVLVFLILVLLMAIITLEGKIFDAMNGKKAAAKAASAAKPAAPVKQAAAPAMRAWNSLTSTILISSRITTSHLSRFLSLWMKLTTPPV